MERPTAAANAARSTKKLDPGRSRARPDIGAVAAVVAAGNRKAGPTAHPESRSRPTEAALGRLVAKATARGSAGHG